jgi:hypothetical protein
MEDENNQKEIIIDNIIKKITNSIERKVKQLNSIETDLKEKKKTFFNEFNDVKDIKLSNDENELKLHNEKLVEEEKRIRIIIDNYNKNKIKVDEDINIYNLKENVPNLNTKKINLQCMEDTVFDYLQTIKKLLTKKVIKFEDGLKETRNISRELFNIKFLQIKLLNEEGKV